MSQIVEARVSAAYRAAREAVAYYLVPNPGTLLIHGETRVEYLQRQSTNDMGLLAANRALPNILTSASGRILEVFILVQDGDANLLLTQPGHAPGLAVYFQKHLFFNDQVKIEDHSRSWAQLELHGPQAAAARAELGFEHSPALDEVLHAEFEGQPLRVFGEEGFASSPSFKLIMPSSLAEELVARLKVSAAEPLDRQTREILRVESGKPGAPEFVDANTPFEIGLDRFVSAEKGCYTGQEVLARQVTYDKVVRNLAQLSAEQPIPVGAAVQAEGKTIGTVSSAAASPRLGELALAVLRKPYAQPDTKVDILTGTQTVPARIH